MPVKRQRVFYGWWIVAMGGVVNAVSGGAYTRGITVFFLPVAQDLGASRTALSWVYALARSLAGMMGPVTGYMVDRFGPKKMVFVGGLLAGAGFILLALTQNFLLFALVFVGVLSLGFDLGFNQGVMAAINNWFIRHRALAMSVAAAGTSLGGAFLVPLLGLAVRNAGWRFAAFLCGAVILAVVLPVSLLIRRSPEGMGLHPDGLPPRPADPGPSATVASPRPPTVDFAVGEAFRTVTYWLLALAMAMRIAVETAAHVHLVPLMVWKGQSEATAALLVGVFAFATLPMALLSGWLGDRWSSQRTAALGLLVGALSLVVLMVSTGHLWQMVLFVTMLAVAESIGTVTWAMIGEFFGRRNFATLRGSMILVQSVISVAPPVVAGWVFDTTGSYLGALVPLSIVYVVSACLFWRLPRPRPPRRLGHAA